MSESIVLLDPAAEGLPEYQPAAQRLKDLRGVRIGLLDNIKHNGEHLLTAVGQVLAQRFDCEVQLVKKKTYTKVAEPRVLADLADCRAVITAIGD
jgi:hypothetical protein